MANLLIITKTVDENDQLLGFFIGWLREFAKKYDRINVLCLEKGSFSLPENIKVISLGKDRNNFQFPISPDSQNESRILDFAKQNRDNSQSIFNFKIFKRIKYLWNLYKNIWQLRREYDVVFVHMNAIYVVVGAWLWLLLGKKVFLWYAHKTITWQHRVAEKFVEGIFASTLQGFRLKTPKLHIVGQGIDIGLFRPNFQFPISPDSQNESRILDFAKQNRDNFQLRILSVGRIAPIKNYGSLIEAAEILDKRGIDFLITIVGAPIFPEDFEYEKELKELIKNKHLETKIKFEGKISNKDLPSYYQSHRLYINLSRTGSLDKTIVEAMASGCTVLSSNDSAREFLPSELIIPDSDPIKLADKIIEVKDKDYGKQLREYVIKNHSLENLIEKISNVINNRNDSVLVVGYPYIKESYIKTFEHYPNRNIFFLLPEVWKAKGGKIEYRPPISGKLNILTTPTYFYHSNYPIVGGMLKGWMPWLPFFLYKLRRKRLGLLFSPSEPVLLTTLWNGIWAKLFGLKHVVFSWENIPFSKKLRGVKGAIQRFVLKANMALADGIICGNKKCFEIFTNYQLLAISYKLLLCPLAGVDENLFKPGDSQEFKKQYSLNGKLVFSFAGAIGYRKGIHIALKAFKKVLTDFPNSRFVIAGSGEYEKEINALVQELELGDLVVRIPWLKHDQLPELLNASDVFLYPSLSHAGWEEQFGYSMAEASACEVPVIATKSGSIEDVVADGKTGILVEENNVEQLANAMAKLASDEILRKEMGRAGRKFILENYSNQVVAQKFYEFFNKI